MQISADTAETFALRVLAWLVGNDELLPVFLGASGANEADLRARAAEPEFLGSVLDFLTMDDTWVVQCCDVLGVGYELPMQARQMLPGGDQVHWT